MSIRQRDKSIDPRKPQKWQILVELGNDSDVNRKRAYKPFFGTKKQAELEERKLTLEARGGILAISGKLTVEELLRRWLATKGDKWAYRTALRNVGIVNDHIIPITSYTQH